MPPVAVSEERAGKKMVVACVVFGSMASGLVWLAVEIGAAQAPEPGTLRDVQRVLSEGRKLTGDRLMCSFSRPKGNSPAMRRL